MRRYIVVFECCSIWSPVNGYRAATKLKTRKISHDPVFHLARDLRTQIKSGQNTDFGIFRLISGMGTLSQNIGQFVAKLIAITSP